ncbi:hypothetical protein [Halocalculus aciditolerans]|uniref:Uncharacterized protein n=1 Tax=Halocalculus aciditolerans TaxID=1383812 RepID=A0A830FIT8_9EURY|nr:hypothetical protein [Halocalculus aciditolerans]GGL60205.1 hypothetical protein GCM10009039_18070 [Halocalculus aciditolerans]
MAYATAVRYTSSALEALLALGLLALGAVHVAAGAAGAVLPVFGGVVLLGAAAALAPVSRRRLVGAPARWRRDVVVFVGALGLAAASVAGWIAVGRLV